MNRRPLFIDPILAPLEATLTREFTNHLALPDSPRTVTLPEAQNTLQQVQAATGIKPALLYITFVPQTIGIDLSPQDGDPLEILLITATGAPIR
ncbi:MAG: hypothetical protein HC936_16395, partial [Leptolyngbyaceae cyanobacterium SU_3_3]|nr:hypothetical protein [Leptolyngbyaceae cyanobacterium SU_3_3]